MNHCTCDLDNLDLTKKDIVISRVPFKYHKYESNQQIELFILNKMDQNNYQLGNIHHFKLHVDPSAETQIIFLRFCNPSVPEEVIKTLNGIEWPKGTRHHLQLRFNRAYTRAHQARHRERLEFRNASVQTEIQGVLNDTSEWLNLNGTNTPMFIIITPFDLNATSAATTLVAKPSTSLQTAA